MSAKVVPLRPTYHGVRDAEDAMTVIRNAMDGHDLSLLAVRVGVSASCLYSIRSGRTKWPRHVTFFSLLSVLDLEMVIRPRTGN